METLNVPPGGTPPVIENRVELASAISSLKSGSGPIAIDAERASGYRYSSRAYLIQIYRRGGGLHLLDPIALTDVPEIAALNEVISNEESVIHASSQDLECLREFGIDPKLLFDTELGARIAGCERVGLGSLCETLLSIQIAKEHSAVDWSLRPLKPEWLDYAALDVAVLLDIRDGVERLLLESGKLDWAREEFENSLKVFPAKIKRDPWRRTSGMHQIKSRFELALIRELWLARDKVARDLDIAPGRLLSDSVIVELSRKKPESYEELLKLSIIREKIRHDDQKSQLKNWWRVLSGAYEMDQDHWPEMRARGDGLPQPRIWRDKFPIAYIHYQHARLNLGAVAQELNIPLENLVSPDLVRRITFDDGQERIYRDLEKSKVAIEVALREGNARDWQIRLTSEPLARSLAQTEAPELPEEPAGEE